MDIEEARGPAQSSSRPDEVRVSDRDYFIGTETHRVEVEEAFQDSKYFGGSDGHYSAKGMHVEVTGNGIEYDVDEEIDDKVVTEFVEGIVRSFEDVEDSFIPDVEQGIYEESRGIAADGSPPQYDPKTEEVSGISYAGESPNVSTPSEYNGEFDFPV